MADDMMSTLKGLLGDNAEEKIRSVLSALGNNTPEDSSPEPQLPEDSPVSLNSDALESVGKLKSIIDDIGKPNDTRSNLLMSLRPYMRNERQKSIDSAIKLLNLSKISGLFRL